MNAVVTSLDRYQPSHSSAFQNTLSQEALGERVPAVFAAGAHERTSSALGARGLASLNRQEASGGQSDRDAPAVTRPRSSGTIVMGQSRRAAATSCPHK